MSEEIFAWNCHVHRELLSEPGHRAYWNAQKADVAKVAPNFAAFVERLCVGEVKDFGLRI